jgi:hypothetical protein
MVEVCSRSMPSPSPRPHHLPRSRTQLSSPVVVVADPSTMTRLPYVGGHCRRAHGHEPCRSLALRYSHAGASLVSDEVRLDATHSHRGLSIGIAVAPRQPTQ